MKTTRRILSLTRRKKKRTVTVKRQTRSQIRSPTRSLIRSPITSLIIPITSPTRSLISPIMSLTGGPIKSLRSPIGDPTRRKNLRRRFRMKQKISSQESRKKLMKLMKWRRKQMEEKMK